MTGGWPELISEDRECGVNAVATIDIWLRTGRPGFDPRQRQRIFLLAPASRLALGPTQPPVQWMPEVLFPGVKRGRGVMLTTHPHLVPRLRMSRSSPLPPGTFMACSGTALPLLLALVNWYVQQFSLVSWFCIYEYICIFIYICIYSYVPCK
jgi:hypothetical protein